MLYGRADDGRIADLSRNYDPVLAAVRGPSPWICGRKWRNETEIASVLKNLKERRYKGLTDMAKQNYRQQAWARWFMTVIVEERKAMTLEEFASCLTSPAAQRRLLREASKTSQVVACDQPLTREEYEQILPLDIDEVVWLLRRGGWASEEQFANDFRQDILWVRRFKAFLVQSQALTALQWEKSFRKTRWRKLTAKYFSAEMITSTADIVKNERHVHETDRRRIQTTDEPGLQNPP